jgi:hypothetical protein
MRFRRKVRVTPVLDSHGDASPSYHAVVALRSHKIREPFDPADGTNLADATKSTLETTVGGGGYEKSVRRGRHRRCRLCRQRGPGIGPAALLDGERALRPFNIQGLIPSYPDARDIQIPINMWVLDHPKGLVVYDTGNNVAISDGQCLSHWVQGMCDFLQPDQTWDDVIDRQLEKLGFTTEDVKILITSHSHLDHIGNIEMFPNALHVIQKKELYQAWWPEKFQRGGAHVLEDYDEVRDFNYVELEGDYDLFGDGSGMIYSTPGHTMGPPVGQGAAAGDRHRDPLPGRDLDGGEPGGLSRRAELQRARLHQLAEQAEEHAGPGRGEALVRPQHLAI